MLYYSPLPISFFFFSLSWASIFVSFPHTNAQLVCVKPPLARCVYSSTIDSRTTLRETIIILNIPRRWCWKQDVRWGKRNIRAVCPSASYMTFSEDGSNLHMGISTNRFNLIECCLYGLLSVE